MLCAERQHTRGRSPQRPAAHRRSCALPWPKDDRAREEMGWGLPTPVEHGARRPRARPPLANRSCRASLTGGERRESIPHQLLPASTVTLGPICCVESECPRDTSWIRLCATRPPPQPRRTSDAMRCGQHPTERASVCIAYGHVTVKKALFCELNSLGPRPSVRSHPPTRVRSCPRGRAPSRLRLDTKPQSLWHGFKVLITASRSPAAVPRLPPRHATTPPAPRDERSVPC